MNASLNEKLRSVKWGEYRLGDLFESSNGDYDIQKTHINGRGDYVITSGLTNNGILGKTDITAKIFQPNTITVDMFGSCFFRDYLYKLVTHARVFSLKPMFFSLDSRSGLFISTAISRITCGYGYENMCSWEKIKEKNITLPRTIEGQIDFDFMESFVAELEAERVAELEAERVAELSAYLKVSGLDNYELSSEEKNCLLCTKVCWKEYRLGDLFDILSYKKRFDANKVTLVEKNGHPYIVRQGSDNGQKGLIKEDEAFLNDGNTISFGQDTATMFYQEKAYFTGDKIKILKPKFEWFEKENAQFFLASMHRSFSSFSWGSSSFSKGVIENQKIYLPTTVDDRIDFNYISVLISAIQKLVIKDVVQFTNRKLDTYKNIVSKSSFRYQISEQRSMIAASADKPCLDY